VEMDYLSSSAYKIIITKIKFFSLLPSISIKLLDKLFVRV